MAVMSHTKYRKSQRNRITVAGPSMTPAKKTARMAGFHCSQANSELVNQAGRHHVIRRHTGSAGEPVVVNQVDFVVDVGGHVFVEEIRCTEVNVVQQVLVAVALDVLAAGVQIGNGRPQPGVELVLRHGFKVLRLVGKAPGMVAVIATETGGVVALGVLCREIDVVGVILQAAGVGGGLIPVAEGQFVLLVRTL